MARVPTIGLMQVALPPGADSGAHAGPGDRETPFRDAGLTRVAVTEALRLQCVPSGGPSQDTRNRRSVSDGGVRQFTKLLYVFDFIGEPGGARTSDHRIKSAMLYQLSYRLALWRGKSEFPA